jgi:hypothetical protein
MSASVPEIAGKWREYGPMHKSAVVMQKVMQVNLCTLHRDWEAAESGRGMQKTRHLQHSA